MIPFQMEKIENAIAYLASEYRKRRGYWPFHVWIYKVLALLDFASLRKRGTPFLGLEYDAMERGPVPTKFYYVVGNGIPYNGEKFNIIPSSKGKARVISTEDYDLDIFSGLEIEDMDSMLDRFAVNSKDEIDILVHATHKEIRSWNVAWNSAQSSGRSRMPMSWKDEFDGIFDKHESELTPEEERFVVFHRLNQEESVVHDEVFA
jgi:hypothetical protein